MSSNPHTSPLAAYPATPARTGSAGYPLKRVLDAIVAAIGLAVLSPLLALIALLIAVETGRPVIYRQERHGLDRTPFMILKFRTLYVSDADGVFRQVMTPHDGVTRVGRILRRYNLDELPQLWNVLIGDMSLVGPRPHPVAMDARYETQVPGYFSRYRVKPGMTGWAQINGLRGPTATLDSIAKRIAHDLHYINTQSLWLDCKILLLTFSPAAFKNAH